MKVGIEVVEEHAICYFLNLKKLVKFFFSKCRHRNYSQNVLINLDNFDLIKFYLRKKLI